MSYNNLELTAKKSTKRVGRGIAAGQGKTAGRGTKGQKSRTGFSRRPGFEGGQTPLAQRFPKLRGFKSHRTPAEVVYTGDLDALAAKIDNQVLADAGLVSSAFTRVKIVVNGDVTKKHTVSLQAASKTAVTAIEKAGGSFTSIAQVKRPITSKKAQ
jgi:large subunit ribosomal protein L15